MIGRLLVNVGSGFRRTREVQCYVERSEISRFIGIDKNKRPTCEIWEPYPFYALSIVNIFPIFNAYYTLSELLDE